VIFGRAATAARRTFRSLRVRNYRLYMTGQVISMIGTWMQSVAQAWLVLKLGQSGTALGKRKDAVSGDHHSSRVPSPAPPPVFRPDI